MRRKFFSIDKLTSWKDEVRKQLITRKHLTDLVFESNFEDEGVR